MMSPVTVPPGILGAVNYEDRTGLLRPEEVVPTSLLLRLRLTPDPARLVALSASDPASVRVSVVAHEAIQQRVDEDTAPGRGAPAQARVTAEDAMLCGYRFGQLIVGPLVLRPPVSPAELRRRTDSMDLYALVAWAAPGPAGRVPVHAILARHRAGHMYALEEAATWAWAFGLGLALVEAGPGTAG